MRRCGHELPDAFLAGVGYTEGEITGLRAVKKLSSAASCFLSQAKADDTVVERLYTDLRANDVTCWHYKYDMRGGAEWENQIYEAITGHAKLVLICSRNSIYRPNVVREIQQAIDVERATNGQKLFPIRLDDQILGDSMMEEAREKVRTGEWRENWIYYIRKYHIPDFGRGQDLVMRLCGALRFLI